MEPSFGLQQEQGQNPIPLCTANGARRRIPLYECHVSQVHQFGEQLPALFSLNNFPTPLKESFQRMKMQMNESTSTTVYPFENQRDGATTSFLQG